MSFPLLAPARTRARRPARLTVESLEARAVPAATAYLATDLVSDQAGVAPITDPNLVNAWGIAINPLGAFWVSSNGKDLSTVYTGDVNGNPLAKSSLEVTIPGGAPTGQVFNDTADFVVSSGAASGPAVFIFASESGEVTGWNPLVGVAPGATPPSTTAEVGFTATDGAIYKGIALANNGTGNFLYLADFHNAKIDVLDGTFTKVTLGTGGFGTFTDPNLPAGYAPFNVAAIGGKLYVAYAKQDAAAEDEVAGLGLGIVDVFDLNGTFQNRLISGGTLDAPWAVVQAPAGFGDFSGDLLVGNFGNGRINAFDPTTGAFAGTLSSSPGHPLVVDGLWGLAFGNGTTVGGATSLYYAAGPDDETHGLFGKITANAAGTSPVTAVLNANGDLIITGSRDNDKIQVKLSKQDQQVVVTAGGKTIQTFDLAAVGTIQFDGLAGNDRIQVSNHITVATVLIGGAGNDMLIGGAGDNVLVGGTGNDQLFGQGGADVLIGGDGRDLLQGRAGDDLLIGGSTTFDADPGSLLQILGEWTSTDPYATRVDKLRNGTGGPPKLDPTTVTDDLLKDLLMGGMGLDWFFAGTGDLTPGKVAAELMN
jgi:uncharacterized protein (TIGR03118 family)